MHKKRNDLVGGIILLAIGLFALLNQFVDLTVPFNVGLLFLPALGALFLVLGLATREAGWIIPGGIISGIGWGAALISGWFTFSGDKEGGVFLLVFAGGFVLITLLTALFTKETHWWALIPGGIIGTVDLGILFGGVFFDILTFAGKVWPVALIVLGVYVLYQGNRQRSEPKEKESLS